MENFERLTPAESRLHAKRFRLVAVASAIAAFGLLALFNEFAPNRPVTYNGDLQHFYYGSIGSDISGGLPLKVMRVLPKMFPEYLPDDAKRKDYTAFGFISPPNKRMPIGFSIRRQFIDFTGMNCAACHTGVVRASAKAKRKVIPGMPANTVDLLSFFKFLFRCAEDERFTAAKVLEAMEEMEIAEPTDHVIYPTVVPRMREALVKRKKKLQFLLDESYPAWGPGRVNTFDTFKFDQFAYYYEAHDEKVEEIYGNVDFPPVWNQRDREGLWLHWDGNNDSVRERNFSAAIGAGAEPQDMDIDSLFRIERWLNTLPPPNYRFAIDKEQARRGAEIYKEYCFECHDFDGERVGTVLPHEEIGTDRHRMDSYTPFLRKAQQDYTEGYFWSFDHFRNTKGYAAHPLDGLWARAPYLHNGSVPTLWDLLHPADQRPKVFTRGSPVFNQRKLGFEYEVLSGSVDAGYTLFDGSPYDGSAFVYDTKLPGNDNKGHSGPGYGTQLSDEDKRALIEYFKWRDRPEAGASHSRQGTE